MRTIEEKLKVLNCHFVTLVKEASIREMYQLNAKPLIKESKLVYRYIFYLTFRCNMDACFYDEIIKYIENKIDNNLTNLCVSC